MYLNLSWFDLAAAASLMILNGGLSVALGLGLERTLLINTVRMLVQLSVIGFVLKFIFMQTSMYWTLGWALMMLILAGYEIMARQSYKVKGMRAYGFSTLTLLFVGFVCTGFAIGFLLQPDPWYSPRYVLPILGMVLGNTMTGIALGMETFTSGIRQSQNQIEGRLLMGEPRYKALDNHIKQALKAGMMPIINSMAASGIVSLPGMMTGQIIAGVDPIDAAKYQIMIMFLIAGGTVLGTTAGVFSTAYLVTDERHRLRIDRLTTG